MSLYERVQSITAVKPKLCDMHSWSRQHYCRQYYCLLQINKSSATSKDSDAHGEK